MGGRGREKERKKERNEERKKENERERDLAAADEQAVSGSVGRLPSGCVARCYGQLLPLAPHQDYCVIVTPAIVICRLSSDEEEGVRGGSGFSASVVTERILPRSPM